MNGPQHNPNHIETSTDAGGFYCEHAYFIASVLGRALGCLVPFQGHPAVGFLHVPDALDVFFKLGSKACVQAGVCDPSTASILRQVTRLWGALACDRPDAPMLLTGFGPFANIEVNPSEVAIRDAALMREIAAPADGAQLNIASRVLDVSDAGLRALASEIRQLRPKAILMLGVRRGTPERYATEVVATDRNLQWSLQRSEYSHIAESPARLVLRTNPALALALAPAFSGPDQIRT